MRIRRVRSSALTMALLVLGMGACALRPARADDAKLDGTWKLVVLAFGDDEFAIVKLSSADGKTAATVVDAQQMLLGRPTVKQVDQKGDVLKITLSGSPTGDTTFEGNSPTRARTQARSLGCTISGLNPIPRGWRRQPTPRSPGSSKVLWSPSTLRQRVSAIRNPRSRSSRS